MAKVSFNKLGINKDIMNQVKNIKFNEQQIEIKQYLPIEQKLKLIVNVMNNAADENNFSNPVKNKAFFILGVVASYTNITFTEKQLEDSAKIYDYIIASGLWSKILDNIPESELQTLENDCYNCIDAVYKYRNSLFGVLEALGKEDLSEEKEEANNIQKMLADPKVSGFLKEVMQKMG